MERTHFRFWPRHLARNLTLPQTSLWANLEVSSQRYADKPCLVFYDTVITYRQVRQEAEWLAGYLQTECAVKRGDRVALFLHNSPQFVIAFYAVLRAGAVVVPVNTMNLTGELEHVLEDSGATVLITAQELFLQAEPLLGRLVREGIVACYADYLTAATNLKVPAVLAGPRRDVAGDRVVQWSAALARQCEPRPHEGGPEDLCVLPYTSGTTGRPKGCVHRHRNVMHTVVSTCLWHAVHQDDRNLAVLPFFHVTGMQNSMNVPLYAGATIVLLPRWDREVALQLIERYRVTRLTCVPTMIVDLLSGTDSSSHDLSSLTSIGGGGAAMPEAVAHKLRTVWGLTYLEGYGLSETMAPTHMNPVDRPKAQCLGIPIFDTDSRVVDPATFLGLPAGEVGEIVTRGPQVCEGYWNRPAASAECFVELDGERFLRTGDLGRTDEDGYFFFVDRLKRMINVAGFKVWPAEVESQLHAHPAVREVVVISTPDARCGEKVKALVVLAPEARSSIDHSGFIEWARKNMAAYKVPQVVEFVDSLPRSGTGKIMWRTLQERENAAAATRVAAGSVIGSGEHRQ